MEAEFIKDVTGKHSDRKLYKCTPPLDGEEYVVVSAVIVNISAHDRGPETYIFPADSDGDITGWGELSGSFKGALDHVQALKNAGYSVVS